MELHQRLSLEEFLAQAFVPLSANLDAGTNILQVMQRLDLEPDLNLNPMNGKKKYIKSSFIGLDDTEILRIAENSAKALQSFEKCILPAGDLQIEIDKIKSDIKSKTPEKLGAVKSEEIRRLLKNIFVKLESITSPDCGDCADVARRYNLYNGEWSEDFWNLIGTISSYIREVPDEDLIGLSLDIVNDLRDSLDCQDELDALARSVNSPVSRPNNLHLIFSTNAKPDINISDVILGNVEVNDDAGGMIFRGNIGNKPLTWSALLNWFENSQYYDSNSSKNSLEQLEQRLKGSITSSIPEKNLFESYWDMTVGARDMDAPAILPQVWLQYDVLAARERSSGSIYTHQRMDFMSFLGGKSIVIIEIDGAQHFSEEKNYNVNGKMEKLKIASPKKYADMVEQDRNLRMRGYEILRYGGYELFGGADANKTRLLIEYLKRRAAH